MSKTPTAKRRRVDAANATLRQPFRSPIIRRPATDANPPIAAENETLKTAGSARPSGRHPAPETGRPAFVWSLRREEFEAKNAALEEEIARLRRGEGEVTGSGRDELDELVVKWRAAAQQAADELFETSRSRVQSMGGMKELAAMRRRQAEFFNEELGQYARKPGSNEGASGDEDLYPDSKRVQEEEEEKEEEEYTMSTMLRSLNIDVDVIGYDEAEECWK